MNFTFLSKRLAMLDGEPTIWCPGCRNYHSFAVNKPNVIGGRDHRWSFNGSADRPTFSPSYHQIIDGRTSCHLFLTDGTLQFLADSAHALAGQSMPLPEYSYVDLLRYGYYDDHPGEYPADSAAYHAGKNKP
jgi:hypothetical protein